MAVSETAFRPVVSIITVVYNNKEGLEKTIGSVVGQDYSAIDFVVIDGGSTDGTLEIIRKYQDKISYWVSEKDKGIYDAMNKGLHAAKGEYVLFLNSGDLLTDDFVLSKVFASEANADCYYGETYLINEKGVILGTRTQLTTRKLPAEMNWKSMINGMVVSHQSILFRKTLVPFYNLEYKCSADIDWVISSLKKSKKIVNTRLVISRYLIGGYSIANQKRCWKERFQIYCCHYGVIHTILAHFRIAFRNAVFKIRGRKNY